MSRPRIIPPKLNDTVMALTAEGLTASKIAEILLKDHQIKVKPDKVSHLIAVLSAERREIARAEYAKQVAEHANLDLDIIGNKIMQLNQLMNKGLKNEDLKTINISGNLLIRFIDRRIQLAGMDGDTKPSETDEALIESILSKLGK